MGNVSGKKANYDLSVKDSGMEEGGGQIKNLVSLNFIYVQLFILKYKSRNCSYLLYTL